MTLRILKEPSGTLIIIGTIIIIVLLYSFTIIIINFTMGVKFIIISLL